MTKEEPKETTDYTKKTKKATSQEEPALVIEKVVTGQVVKSKRNIGTKIKELFIEADLRTVVSYVGHDIIIPAIRSMIADGVSRGAERALFGESRFRRPPGYGSGPGGGIMSKITYNTPVTRDYDGWRDPRTNPPGPQSLPRAGRPDFFFQTKEDASSVLEHMYDIFNVYEYVSVSQMQDLMGVPSAHTDEKWGWLDLRGSNVRQDRGGVWVIDLPKPQELPF